MDTQESDRFGHEFSKLLRSKVSRYLSGLCYSCDYAFCYRYMICSYQCFVLQEREQYTRPARDIMQSVCPHLS